MSQCVILVHVHHQCLYSLKKSSLNGPSDQDYHIDCMLLDRYYTNVFVFIVLETRDKEIQGQDCIFGRNTQVSLHQQGNM